MQVKHLSRNAIDSILAGRKDGPYTSLADFMARTAIEEHEAESLIRCGAMDAFGTPRRQMLWELKLIMKAAARAQPFACDGQRAFQELWSIRDDTSQIPPAPFKKGEPSPSPLPVRGEGYFHSSGPLALEYSPSEKLWAELECLDLTVSEHLLALYGVRTEPSPDGTSCTLTLPAAERSSALKLWPRSILPVIAARDLSRHAGRLATLAGWMITAKRTRTGRGELMKFMTLEDPTACFEVTLFPKVYRQFGALLYDRGPFIVRGRVERDGLCCTLTALWIARLPGVEE